MARDPLHFSGSVASDGEPIFAARLTPYRSLGPNGFLLLMLFVGATCFISGMLFLVIGAWPIFLFFGLDGFLVWLAFRINYRAARQYEEIAIWPHALTIRKVSHHGKGEVHSFNPFWTRFIVDRHEEFGVTRMAVASKGRELVIGAFLNPADRDSFAVAFSGALSSARK